MGGTLFLISCVMHSLRRRTSCCKSFNIAAIRATGSGSFLAFLCSDTTSYPVRGTSFLCLKATSFSPTGLEATGGILFPLLFLCLGAMLLWRDCFFPLLYPVPSGVAKMWVCLFSSAHRPKDLGPSNCSLVDWAWFTAAKGSCLRTKWCTWQASYNTYKLAKKTRIFV